MRRPIQFLSNSDNQFSINGQDDEESASRGDGDLRHEEDYDRKQMYESPEPEA